MSSLIEMGQRAKDAAVVLATLSTPAKNKALLASADALLAAKAEILAKNKADVDAAVEAGIKGAFIDRLTLTEARLADMAEGLRQVAKQCVNYGQRVQNSVFECILDAAQCRQLQHKLCSLMDKEKDSLRFYYLGNRYEAKVEHFGINAGYQQEGVLMV